jgi:hypothetical protein
MSPPRGAFVAVLMLAIAGCGGSASHSSPGDGASEHGADEEHASTDANGADTGAQDQDASNASDSDAEAAAEVGSADAPLDGEGDSAPDAVSNQDASIVDVRDANPSDGIVIEAGRQSAACLAKNTSEYSIVFQGSGLGDFEGKTVVLMTTDSTTDNRCRTTGSVQIRDGAFRAEVFNLTANAYPFMGAFIDVGGDGYCSGGIDPSWTTIFTLTQRQVVAPLTAKDFKVSSTCGSLFSP